MSLNQDFISPVDSFLYQAKNFQKNSNRKKKICCFLFAMLIFVTFELCINGRCFLKATKLKYLFIDCTMYFGVVMITFQEKDILQRKMEKKFQNHIRLRAQIWYLCIYEMFVFSILILSILHVGVQIYYFSFEFCQECFYFQRELKDAWSFFIVKSIIFVLFIIIELIIIYFLVQVNMKNVNALRKPKKFKLRPSNFKSMSNDVIWYEYN